MNYRDDEADPWDENEGCDHSHTVEYEVCTAFDGQERVLGCWIVLREGGYQLVQNAAWDGPLPEAENLVGPADVYGEIRTLSICGPLLAHAAFTHMAKVFRLTVLDPSDLQRVLVALSDMADKEDPDDTDLP